MFSNKRIEEKRLESQQRTRYGRTVKFLNVLGNSEALYSRKGQDESFSSVTQGMMWKMD